MARNLYGGRPGDVVASISSDDGDYAPTTATFDIYDARTGGTKISDLADISGASITQVTPPPGEPLEFYGPDGMTATLWAQATTGGRRWAVNPTNISSVAGPSTPGSAATITVGSTTTGAAGTPATVTNAGTSSAAVLNFVIPVGAKGDNGLNGQSGRTQIKFRQDGEAAQAVNLQPEVIPFSFTIDGAIPTVSKAPSAAAIELDVTRDGTSLWANTANRPRVPVGAKAGALAIPDSVGPYPAGTQLSMNVMNVGDATSTALNPTIKGYLTGDSGTGSATSFAIPTTGYVAPNGTTPVSRAAGDLMLIWVVSGQPATLPGGFASALAADPVAANMRGLLAARTATATAADGATVTLAGTGSPYSYKVVLIANPGATEAAAATAPAAGPTATSSALTTTGTNEVGVWFAGWRSTAGAQPGVTISGGAAPAELSDTVTTRTGTNTNFGSATAWKSLPTAGANAATTYTTAPSSSVQWVEAVVAVKSGVGAGSPGENVTVTVWIREYVETEVGGGA